MSYKNDTGFAERQITIMKPYLAYKDSGIEWIGEVPLQWEVRRLKRFCTFTYGNSLANEDRIEGAIPVYGSNGVVGYHNRAMTHKPCIIIGRKGSYGKINFSESECFPIDTTYFVDDRSTKADMRWLKYVLPFLELDKFSKDTGVPGLNREDAHNKFVPIPENDIQKAIVDYLDSKTSQIDDLIAKKERMIELLKEERVAIINQAVTKGLDPKSEMKDSGIEWLGKVPKHWGLQRLKYLLSDSGEGIRIGPFGSSLKAEFITDQGYKVYGQENVISDDFSIGYRFINQGKFAELNVYELNPGDVIVTMMGTTGKSKVVPEGIKKGIMDSHLIRMRFNKMVNPSFISFLINDSHYIFTQLRIYSKGSIMEGLNSSIIKALFIASPPVKEQEKIMSYLSQKLGEIDKIIYKESQGIDFLKEYRTALIFEVVTGKIDARN